MQTWPVQSNFRRKVSNDIRISVPEKFKEHFHQPLQTPAAKILLQFPQKKKTSLKKILLQSEHFHQQNALCHRGWKLEMRVLVSSERGMMGVWESLWFFFFSWWAVGVRLIEWLPWRGWKKQRKMDATILCNAWDTRGIGFGRRRACAVGSL